MSKYNQLALMKSRYIIGCDGARSITRRYAGIEMKTELPPLRMINVLFNSKELKEKMTVPKRSFWMREAMIAEKFREKWIFH